MYLTVIIDLFNRKVVGWSMSDNLSTEATITPAWKMAIKSTTILSDTLIFHSDRGLNMLVIVLQKLLKVIMV